MINLNEEIEERVRMINGLIELPEFDNVVKLIVGKIYKEKCIIGKVPTSNGSMHKTEANSCIIWLKKDLCIDDSKEWVWDLLHEFGHHQDKIKLSKNQENNDKLEFEREVRAWEIADAEFALYPILQKYEGKYRFYKKMCLKSYEIKLN